MWVELYNPGDQIVDIGNWKESIIAKPWVGPIIVPNRTEILPKKFNVAEGDLKWTAIDNATVRLIDSQGNKVNETPPSVRHCSQRFYPVPDRRWQEY